MKIFVTGATGFVGSALVPELLQAGHQVLGLTRSAAGVEALRAAGVQPLHGSLEDLDSLRLGAAQADGVIHLAFSHDFSKREQNVADERQAIGAIGEVLVGSGRPFVVTSGTAMAANVDGQPSMENSPLSAWHPRAGLETVTAAFTERRVATSLVRLPQVHDTRKQGLVPWFLTVARQKGVSAYLGDGGNRWPAAHVTDVARLYLLAFEKAEPGAVYHAVDEEGVSVKAIAEAHGRGLGVPTVSLPPEEAEAHFGWLAAFAKTDMPSSSVLTRQKLGWHPAGRGLIADLDAMDYSQA